MNLTSSAQLTELKKAPTLNIIGHQRQLPARFRFWFRPTMGIVIGLLLAAVVWAAVLKLAIGLF